MRGFKIANAPLGRRILEAMRLVTGLEKKRAKIPTRVPVQQVTEGEVINFSVERKNLTDLLKMVAYQAEGDHSTLPAGGGRGLPQGVRVLAPSQATGLRSRFLGAPSGATHASPRLPTPPSLLIDPAENS